MNREPAVAGTFYPLDPVQLKQTLSSLLEQIEQTGPAPKAIIVPHAGYIYSGPTAAKAYARLRSEHGKIRRVVLLGPTHRVAVRGLATVSTDGFNTPLGTVAIDQEAIATILDLPQVSVSDEAHAQEHSLEVHLPFLQTILDEFTLVPLIVGEANAKEVAEVIEALWGGDETLIVISSDLSHFHDYETANRRDKKTSQAIESLRYEDINHEDACGRTPISGLLHLARLKHFDIHMIDLCNSGDTAGSHDRVVGYGAYVLNDSPKNTRFTWQDGQTLITLARASIQHGLEYGRALDIDSKDYDPHLQELRASFVTLKKNHQLRGCIGSLEARQPLINDVAHNAWAAAFKDPRFGPLKADELNEIDIHLSLLSVPTPMSFGSETDLLSKIRPGIDGLILEDNGHKGTFLPSVWEGLPDKKKFWRELKRKAGLPYDHWSDTLRVQRYETQAFP